MKDVLPAHLFERDDGRLQRRAVAVRRVQCYFVRKFSRLPSRRFPIVFDELARRLNLSRRTIERAVADLRARGVFEFKKNRGPHERSYHVDVSDRHRSIRGVFPPRREKSKARSPDRFSGFKPEKRKIDALAASLARWDLQNEHWDNCKINWRFPHAFNFARRSLTAGHPIAEILQAYGAALHQRHRDATDFDLNHGCHLARWEPSSTVSLARKILDRDDRTVGQRWREFLGVGQTHPARRPAGLPDFGAEQLARIQDANKRAALENHPLYP